MLYLIQAVIFFMLPTLTNVTLFSAAFAVIGLCYGGGFGTMPSFHASQAGFRARGCSRSPVMSWRKANAPVEGGGGGSLEVGGSGSG